jgi:dTDP-4-dehydrorhamnose reductase
VRLLVAGGSGFIGGYVVNQALATGAKVDATWSHSEPAAGTSGVTWHRLDVTDEAAVRALVAGVAADAVVNATRHDGWSVLTDGAVHMAAAAVRAGARLVHLSSDALFTGRPEWFTEADVPEPVYLYGAAKAAAEVAVAIVDPSAVLVRISAVCGDPDRGVLAPRERFMLDLAAGTATGVLYADDIRCPIGVVDLAAALVELCARPDVTGVLHVAGPEPVSYHELGRIVVARYGGDPDRLPAAAVADSGDVRPGDVKLDSSKARGLLATRPRGVRELFARV